MDIIRYRQGSTVAIGVRVGERLTRLPVGSLAELLVRPLTELRSTVDSALESTLDSARESTVDMGSAAPGAVRLLPPVDGLTEVWAAGVTYRRSSDARQEESQVADVYARVYAAPRPELFFKAPAWRVCGPGEPIGVRPDSAVNVPEPELAVVGNAAGEIVGLTICDDVSSRSIEGENPLYLPQAKMYTGSCALGPGLVPIWTVTDLGRLAIRVAVTRAGAVVWSGHTSTAELHRDPTDLMAYLYRHASFPHGVVLSTGTGLVPDLSFSLRPGDEVRIDIDGIGTLTNPVRPSTVDGFGWLTPEPSRAPD